MEKKNNLAIQEKHCIINFDVKTRYRIRVKISDDALRFWYEMMNIQSWI